MQDVADYVGDSLGLSRQAAATDASTVVFCGVHFMAETATAILSPEKTILLPDLGAGCSLAATIDAGAAARVEGRGHPGAVVVSYVNTTAEVKAESDYCCTSGNAKSVIDAIPEDTEILFLPDMYLGLWLEKVTGRKLEIWMGECHVHAGIRPADIDRWTEEAPDAELLVHPECGCASQAMAFANDRTQILSTEKMIDYAKRSPKQRFIIATETGIIHRLQKEAPGKTFEPRARRRRVPLHEGHDAREGARSPLRDVKKHVVTVEPELAAKARRRELIAWSRSRNYCFTYGRPSAFGGVERPIRLRGHERARGCTGAPGRVSPLSSSTPAAGKQARSRSRRAARRPMPRMAANCRRSLPRAR